MLTIDGSYGEAGGQILRTAIGLSVLTQIPIRVFNIRAKRAQPGLKTQHLEGLRAAGQLCGAKIKGDRLGSTEVEFVPGLITKSELEINIPTAGAIGLVLQTLQLACVRAAHAVNIIINGGADFGKFAPPIPWLQNVLLPILARMGYKIEIKSLRSGFYPKGGAQTEIKIQPVEKLEPLNLIEQGKVKSIKGVSIAAKQLEKRKVAARQAEAAGKILETAFGAKPEIEIRYVEALNPGSGIVLWLQAGQALLGTSAIGQLGITSEQIGQTAANELAEVWKTRACLDRHATDQILPFLALAHSTSVITVPELTSHARTNIWVIEQFLKTTFSVSGTRPVRITCSGSGL